MAYRKGLVLQFGMVTCIVAIDGAVGKEESLKTVCCGTTATGEHVPTPIEQRRYCSTCDATVEYTDLKKAQEIGSGQFKVVDQQDVASVRDATQGATKKMLTLTVHDATEVAEQVVYTDGVYYVQPDGAPQIAAYSLLLDAVERHPELVFLTRYTATSAVSTYQLKAFNGQLVIAKVVDPEAVKAPTFTDYIVPDVTLRDQIDMVLGQMATPFDPAAYSNTYHAKLAELLASQDTVEGVTIEKKKTEKSVSTAGAVDLSSQLAAMLGTPASPPAAKTTKGKAKSA